MKRTTIVWVSVVLIAGAAWGQQNNSNNVQNTQSQTSTAVGGGNADSVSTAVVGDNTATAQGGSSVSYSNANAEGGSGVGWSTSTSEGGIGWSDSDSSAVLVLSTTSITNVKNRTAPLSTYPPYLPIWNHGGWGTINGYFPNGPATGDGVYQRMFDPDSEDDMRELKRMLTSLPYASPIGLVGGVLNGVVALFGGPDNYQRGRGFEIANALVRDRRPDGKALIVFIDSLIDPQLLKESGYAYVGRVSVEGNPDRNWDQVYSAAVAETLPWDVDLLLVSGGMKGVTVGSNTSFPTGSMGFAQTNYSLSLFGGYASGITEGKGKAVVSASGYRFCPQLLQRRRIPQSLFEKLRKQPTAAAATTGQAPAQASTQTAPAARAITPEGTVRKPGIEVSRELYDMAGLPGTGTADQVSVK